LRGRAADVGVGMVYSAAQMDVGDVYSREVARALQDACAALAPRLVANVAPIVAASMVRNESDIIERFVRHTLGWADAILVIDHSSSDGTADILQALCSEGLPIGVVEDKAFGFHQAARMTDAARLAAGMLDAAVFAPVDADEFLLDIEGGDAAALLRSMAADEVLFVQWRSYIPTPGDDPHEPDVLKRIGMRLTDQPPNSCVKIFMGGGFAQAPGMRISHGNHRAFLGTRRVEAPPVHDRLRLAHYPVRTPAQLASKIAAKKLSTPFAPERSPMAGWYYDHVIALFPQWWMLTAAQLQYAAESYFSRNLQLPLVLTHDPLGATGEALRYGALASCDPLGNVYQIAELMMQRLGERRDGLAEYSGLRQPITEENRMLRQTLERLARQFGIDGARLTPEDLEREIMARLPALVTPR
jgi:hypothetical protein